MAQASHRYKLSVIADVSHQRRISKVKRMKKNLLVVGASRGIGAEVAKYFADSGYKIFGVSRSPSEECEWIKADISTVEGIEKIATEIVQTQIDALIYSSGAWEEKGFMEEFDFRETTDNETRHIMAVNLVAPIEITKRIAKNLSLSDNPRAIYLGALSGIEQSASSQVAYSASKFGLRGAIQSLRLALKSEKIGFTCINPGNVATEEVMQDIEAGRFPAQTPIPISDIISTIEFVLSTSSCVEVGDINLSQKDG